MESLQAVGEALRTKLKTDVCFKLVRTRVFLRTGIDLDDIRREQDRDASLVTKVLGALSECGHRLA
jgi:hypothetical protein